MPGDRHASCANTLARRLRRTCRYAAAACDGEDDDFLSEGLQIIGMSATLPNVDRVAR